MTERGGFSPRGSVIVAATLLLLSGAVPPQDEAGDIVIATQRLRTVRITFFAMGGQLRRCDVTRSSGTALIDRTMCALVRTCLAEGERGRDRVTACVNRRIDALAAGDMSPLVDPDFSPSPVGSATSPVPQGATDQDTGDIVVTARRQVLRPGRWHFTELSWIEDTGHARRGPYLRQWRRCLPTVQTEEGLTRVLDGEILSARASRPSACRWQITAGHGRVTGRQRCPLQWSLLTGKMDGHVGGDQVELTKRLHVLRRVRVEGPMAMPSLRGEPPARETHATYEVSGRREGDCS